MLTIEAIPVIVTMCVIAMQLFGLRTHAQKLPNKARCLAAGGTLLFMAIPLTTHASVVFQADFNGAGGDTGELNSIVTQGGTAVLFSGTNLASSIGTSSPLFTGEPGYLHLVDSGTGSAGAGATFYPASAANSLDSWFVLQSGTMTFDQINGALDFYFRDSIGSSGWTNTGVDLRPLDVSGGNGGLRIVINAPKNNQLQVELTAKNSAGTTIQDLRANNSAVNVTAGVLYHLAVAANTNPMTGIVMVKLYLAQGNTPIDPSSSAYLIASATSSAAIASTGTNAIGHAFNSASSFQFGQPCLGNGADIKTLDFGSFRIYNSIPAVFGAVTYLPDVPNMAKPNPEPALTGRGIDPFSPTVITSGTAAANTPIGVEWTRSGNPGDGLVVVGDLLSCYTGADEAKDSAYLCYGQNASAIQNVNTSIERQVGDKAAIRLDGSLPSPALYLVWPRNSYGYGSPMVVNQTEAWWIGPDIAAASGSTSLYGRNLSYSISGTAASNAWIYIKPQGNYTGQWVTPTAVNPYKVDFTIPGTLTSGTYEVWGHNGHGGHYGWSGPVLLTIDNTGHTPSGLPWTATQFNVKNAPYNAKGDGVTDDTAAISSALAASGSSAYSTVYFPPGTYMISASLESPSKVRWLGESASTSIIQFKTGNYAWPCMAHLPGGGGNIEIKNLQLNSGTSTNTSLINVNNHLGTGSRISWFYLTNCTLSATNVITVTATANAFASGATAITVSNAAGMVQGGRITGPGFPPNETITSISGTTIGLSLATIAAEPAETITEIGSNELTLGINNPSDHIFLVNNRIIGAGIVWYDVSQCFVDSCTFAGMWDNTLINSKGYSSQMSYTNNTGEDYNYYMGYAFDPSTDTYANDATCTGWSQGVFFKGFNGEGARHNTYIGNNQSNNMGIRLYNADGSARTDVNWGEQISFEYNIGRYYGTPTAPATSTSVTFDPSTMIGGSNTIVTGTLSCATPMIAIVIQGAGLGQWRDVASVNTTTGVVTLAAGQSWSVPPDTTSTLALGWYCANVAVYENFFQGKTNRVGASGAWGITGFLPYGGVLNAIADGNVCTYGLYGIHSVSMVPRSVCAEHVKPNYFNIYMNNIMQNCQQDLGQSLSTSFSYTNTLNMVSSIANIYRNNTGSDTVAGSTVAGIFVESQPNGVGGAMDFTLFDNNTLTDTPAGVLFYNHWSMGTAGNILLQNNAFSLGTAASGGSYGISTVAGTKVGFGGNSYTNFATTYAGTPPGALLEAPLRFFETSASRAVGVSAAQVVTVWNDGSSPLNWNASSDQTWLTLSSTSGTVATENAEGTFTITCAPGSLTSGTSYIGHVTLTSGTQSKKLQVNFTVNP